MATSPIPVLLPMQNSVKNYDWGHPRVIEEITGIAAEGKPQAEVWMGVHPGGPSLVDINGPSSSSTGIPQWKPLPQAIADAPSEFLGQRIRAAGFDSLPFLFKLIAAHKPLSIQCHPSLQSAKEGFARENAQGIALTASNRNYKDPNHKPEIVCALTGMWALSGFRKPKDIVADFRLLAASSDGEQAAKVSLFCAKQADLLEQAARAGSGQLSDAFKKLTSEILACESETVIAILAAAAKHSEDRFVRMIAAANHFPGDSGLLFFIVLTLYHLFPGQALFVPAGILHAYVEGLAVEVMANSDNVLRGGLTPKYIDVPELLANLNPSASETLMSAKSGETVHEYATHCPEFQLFRLVNTSGRATGISLEQSDGPEVLFCTSGRATITVDSGAPGGNQIELMQGHSVYVRPWGKKMTINLEGELYRALVP